MGNGCTETALAAWICNMILLFTALDTARPFHKRDLLNVCCESHGAPITFGYRTKWIADNLLGRSLAGERALIVFCEVPPGSNDFSFHPVRSAVIEHSTPEHDALALNLTLGGFANFGGDRAQREAFLARFGTFVQRSPDRPHPRASGRASKYVRGEDEFPEDGAFNGGWLALVEHMRHLSGLEDVTFIAPQKASTGSEIPSSLFPSTTYEKSRSAYSAVGGSSVELVLRLILGVNAKFQIPECTIKDAVASVSGPFMRQDSAGFEARFLVSFRPAFQEEFSMVTVRVPSSSPNTYVSPEHQVLVRLRVSRAKLFATIALLVAGTLVVSLGPDSVAEFRNPWIVAHKAAVSVVCRAAGSLMLGVGFWLALRKLPFKG
jgi:hypothetical protein